MGKGGIRWRGGGGIGLGKGDIRWRGGGGGGRVDVIDTGIEVSLLYMGNSQRDIRLYNNRVLPTIQR